MALDYTTDTPAARVHSLWASIGLLLVRLPVGTIFIFAAISKFQMGIGKFVDMALPSATKFLTENFGRTFLSSLAWVELAVGILLIVGLLTRVVAALTAMLLVSFMIAATGLSGQMNNMPFTPNLIYLSLALAILLIGPGWLSVDGMLFRPRRRVVMVEPDDRVAP